MKLIERKRPSEIAGKLSPSEWQRIDSNHLIFLDLTQEISDSSVELNVVDRRSAIGHVVLDTIRICAELAYPIPDWAAFWFADAYATVMKPTGKSWDEGFGKPHRNQQERMRELAVKSSEICTFLANNIKLKPKSVLVDLMRQQFGIGEKKAAELISRFEAVGPVLFHTQN